MKKKVSIVLILAMILSIFGSFAYADMGEASRALDDPAVHAFVNKMKTRIKKLTMDDSIKLKQAITGLQDKDTILDGILDLITESDFNAKLRELDVNAESKDLLISEIKDAKNQIDLNDLIIELLEEGNFGDNKKIAYIKINANSDKTVGELADDVVESLLEDDGIKAVYDRLSPVGEKSKAAIAVEIAELVIKNVSMELKSSAKVVIKTGPLTTGINKILKENFDIVTEFKTSDMEGLSGLINDTVDGLGDSQKLALARAITAIKGDNPYPDEGGSDPTDPGGSGSSSGGGGDKSETPPETEEPLAEPEKGQVELGQDAVEVETGENGEAIIKVKEDSMAEAIDELLKIAEEDPDVTPQLIIKLDDIKTLDMEISIPADLMAKLAENGIGLIIESGALTYEVPADALAAILADAPEGSYIEFISSEVDSAEIEELLGDESANVARVIELQLVLRDSNGEPIEGIGKFGSKIKTGIEITAEDGNPDLLAVFYIDEETGELKFVGGKVKDNKINMATDHYSKFAVIEYDKSFSDIEGHWSKDYVKSMVAKHVIDGFEDNTYRPEDKLTRAQFAKLLVEVLEPDKIAYKGEFKDVNDVHWAKDYIATAKQQGIIAGYEDGTFRPEQSINRAEMAAMITNALKLDKDSDSKILEKFKDAQDIPAWAVEYVVPVVEEGLLVGSDGILNPLGYVTRAEAATIIYRIYNR